jgi:putative endonuclease
VTKPEKSWYVYMARCRDGSIYTGISVDVERRIELHNDGKGARFTAGRRPVSLLYTEQHSDEGSARRREAEIKKWRKMKKEALVVGILEGRSGSALINPDEGVRAM